jgi:hypothetical protein
MDKKKILIVEDEHKIARFLELELNYEGYDVVIAYDGRDGLDKGKGPEIDLIILDLMLPGFLMFTGNWNSFLIPSLMATSDDMFTLPVGLNSFYGQYFQFWNQVMAGVMILSIPTIIIFIIFQRNFIKGVATTGIKE